MPLVVDCVMVAATVGFGGAFVAVVLFVLYTALFPPDPENKRKDK